MSAFIDEHRDRFGVNPICRTLDVSASAYYQRRTGRRLARPVRDERLLGRTREIHAGAYYAYGSRRMWKALRRAGEDAGRGRVERLMRANEICGAKRRGEPWRTTLPDLAARRRHDLVDRDFSADRPNELRVANLTYLRCWRSVVFFAYILDAIAAASSAGYSHRTSARRSCWTRSRWRCISAVPAPTSSSCITPIAAVSTPA